MNNEAQQIVEACAKIETICADYIEEIEFAGLKPDGLCEGFDPSGETMELLKRGVELLGDEHLNSRLTVALEARDEKDRVWFSLVARKLASAVSIQLVGKGHLAVDSSGNVFGNQPPMPTPELTRATLAQFGNI